MKVALLQMVGSNQIDANLQKGERFCRNAQALGADLALFPEMWSVGYLETSTEVWGDYNAMFQHALTIESEFVQHFVALARELSIAIAITFLEKDGTSLYNTLLLIDRSGTIVLRYAKVHTCSFDIREQPLTPGSEFKTVALETKNGQVNVGAMICFDREFPESARVLMLQGAEVILVPNAYNMIDSELGDLRVQQVRVRAFENMLGVAVANYAAPQCDGHSCAFTVAGSCVCMGEQEEQIVMADFDLKIIRGWQINEVWGEHHRRPSCYGNIVTKK